MRPPLELWVGAECTINRVGERWRDQAVLTGFRQRLGDLDRLASLGARRVRLPVLWEHVAPGDPDAPDFGWPDRALARLRERGLDAIVGLLHHGSGPRHTHLLDDRFPAKFADYARRVAQRYPGQRAWTPINEPLTTARFACLYGHWYPHRADDRSFVRALLNQVHATVLAMRAIRDVVPDAELVQTDDLGFTRSTPALAGQAAFDNERRWLAFDLLAGRVDATHPLRDWLCGNGAEPDELDRLVDAPCPPDILGINAYVTSERFLDERLHLHPPEHHGGNGREAYADVEAVRAHGGLIDGFAGRLREAHARYRLPLAITEVHLGCTREEQMRWLHQAWQAAAAARGDGIDVRAVTAWAAFGTVDWASLVTRDEGRYEPGLWDVRSEPPRLTALGRLAATLAAGAAPAHPVLASPGWWQRDIRHAVPPHGPVAALPARGSALLIFGATALARAFARLCHMRGLPYELLSDPEIDAADQAAIAQALRRHRPWAVVDASGPARTDADGTDERQRRCNAEVPAVLAGACAAAGLPLLAFASDDVVAGDRPEPWLECDSVAPATARGRAKGQAEQAALAAAPRTLVVRCAALFGPWDHDHFVARGLALLRQGREWPAVADEVVSPTYLPDLVQACLDLLVDGESGVWHLTNGRVVSWAEFARRAARHAGVDATLIRPVAGAVHGRAAPRPAFRVLDSVRARLLPSLDDALARYQRDHEPAPAPVPLLRAATGPPVAGSDGRPAR